MSRGSDGWDVGSRFDGYVQESLNIEGVLQSVHQTWHNYNCARGGARAYTVKTVFPYYLKLVS